MKTSNKLLLVFFVLGFGIYAGIHLTLFAKYRNGEILPAKTFQEELFTQYKLPKPTYLSVEGFKNITIIPSDTFYFEIEKQSNGKATYQLRNDSIFLTGDERERIININQESIVQTKGEKIEFAVSPYIKPLGNQKLILHCPFIKKIRIDGGETFLYGTPTPSDIGADIDIINCNFLLSNYNLYDTTYLNRFYNHIRIHSIKSIIALKKKAVVNYLSVAMDEKSELYDNNATIENLSLDYNSQSRIQLSGENLKKIKSIAQ